jgi:membrane dipeptidase
MNRPKLLIDSLQYSNWNRSIFEQMRAGGVDCAHVTIVTSQKNRAHHCLARGY